MKSIIIHLNKAFESRVRLGIMSILMVNENVSYNRLKELLKVTDGNLASHIKALEKFRYIHINKTFVDKKPHTSYSVSDIGRIDFSKHIDALESLINK